MQTAYQHPGQLTDLLPVQPSVSVLFPFEPHLRSSTGIGGDIELVKSGSLVDFQPIVLIERYSSTLHH